MSVTSLRPLSGATLALGRGGVMTERRLSEYDKKKLDEMNSANLPVFWVLYFAVAIGGMWLLVQFLTWAGR